MNYAKIEYFSTPNGPGCRTAVYFSGCQKALDGNPCIGCHNQIAWDKNYGHEWTPEVEDTVIKSSMPDYISGFSILGGEPLSDFNISGIKEFLKKRKDTYPEKTIWIWTGYKIEDVQSTKHLDIFKYVDYVVDGDFVQSLKVPNLRFRGSTNQRILKVENVDNTIKFIDKTEEFSKNI